MELTKDKRVWHPIFLWGKVLMSNPIKTVMLFDFKSVSYYHMGVGYKTYYNDSTAGNMITLPTEQLYESEVPESELPDKVRLGKLAMNATVELF